MAKSKSNKTLEKPKRRDFKPAYEWSAIEAYIESKYGVVLCNYKRGVDGHDTEYRNFWHWLIDGSSIHNGSFFYLPEDYEGYADSWQAEILGMIFKEFPELKTEPVWVSW